jgi:hypothetical protein
VENEENKSKSHAQHYLKQMMQRLSRTIIAKTTRSLAVTTVVIPQQRGVLFFTTSSRAFALRSVRNDFSSRAFASVAPVQNTAMFCRQV